MQVIVLDPVVMSMVAVLTSNLTVECHNPDLQTIQPVVIASSRFQSSGIRSTQSAVIAESQALLETIAIPGTNNRKDKQKHIRLISYKRYLELYTNSMETIYLSLSAR